MLLFGGFGGGEKGGGGEEMPQCGICGFCVVAVLAGTYVCMSRATTLSVL